MARLNYRGQNVCIRFVGTHREYDQMDVETDRMPTPVHAISNEEDYGAAPALADTVFDAQPGTAESDHLEALVTLLEAYEERHLRIR